MPSKKSSADSKQQSTRFVEAAKQLGADESGKKFERAFKKIVKPKKGKRSITPSGR